MPPTDANGKICYLQIPTEDIARSSGFYQTIFGWNIRRRDNGEVAFDDTTGQVSGAWVTGRPPATTPGLPFYIMVDCVADTITAIEDADCVTVQPIGGDAPEITARFRDPGGNIIGLYQNPPATP